MPGQPLIAPFHLPSRLRHVNPGPPLVHCAGRLGEATGRARWAYAAIGVSTIGVLYMSSTFLRCLTGLTLQWGAWGRLVQGTVLPYATWLILLSMLTLFCVEARANAGSAS